MRSEPPVTDLVTRATDSDQQARDALIERYAPLIWSICRRHQLSAGDVGQSVWLQLVDQLDRVRDPASSHGWLATTTRRECGRILRAARQPHAAGYVLDAQNIRDEQTGIAEHELIIAEPHAVVHEAFIQPPSRQRQSAMFTEDPPRAPHPDQRQPEHPGREHRSQPPRLPGQATPPSGNRRPDQHRSPQHEE
jgi:RNA polymerase sigma factor (sigma-70 family)